MIAVPPKLNTYVNRSVITALTASGYFITEGSPKGRFTISLIALSPYGLSLYYDLYLLTFFIESITLYIYLTEIATEIEQKMKIRSTLFSEYKNKKNKKIINILH